MTSHYKVHKPEAIDLILKYDLNFVEGNVVKYILRSPFKGDSEGDLNKALYYARLLKPSDSRRICEDNFNEYNQLSVLLKIALFHTIESKISSDQYENYVAYCIERQIESNSIMYCNSCGQVMAYWKKDNYKCPCGIVSIIKSDAGPEFYLKGKYFNTLEDMCKYGIKFPELPLDVEQFKRDMQDRISEAEMNSRMNPEFTK